MVLYLIRHGKAISFADKDFNRPLDPKGILQSKFINSYLKKEQSTFSVLSSSAKRTIETKEFSISDLLISETITTKQIYGADYMTIFKEIENIISNDNLIVVAHNPGVSRLASYLVGDVFHFKTGTLMKIEFDIQSWQEISQNTGIFIEQIRLESN